MCGSGPKDNSAEIARQNEIARQRRITEGMNRINQIFGGDLYEYRQEDAGPAPVLSDFDHLAGTDGDPYAGRSAYQDAMDRYQSSAAQAGFERVKSGTSQGQFTDDFFSGLGKSYLDYYTPQLDEQYKNAQKQGIFNFANSGNLGSSSANEFMGNLAKQYQTQRGTLADRALGEQQRVRGEIESNRADLISQLEAGAGVDSAAQAAMARAQALTAPPQYSALGDAFASLTGTLRDSMSMQRQGYAGLPFTKGGAMTPNQGGVDSVRRVG